MSNLDALHECDLFLMSGYYPYAANRVLPEFARRGKRNVHGWGIGSYTNGIANIIRCDRPAVENNSGTINLDREFAVAVKAITSPVIIGHLRLTSRGSNRPENNHPFKLNFLGYDWLLIHNGSASRNVELVPYNQRLIPESDSDTPRIFEFIRQRIIGYYLKDYKKSLIEACRFGFKELLDKDPAGSFNIILTNGYLSFAFIHWRPFYFLYREKGTGDVALITTVEHLTRDEEWQKFSPLRNRKAKMLVFSGHSLIFNGDIPK